MTRRPRLLVLNQYYWPGLEATAHLLSELLAALADEFDVTVVTGRIAVHAPHAERLEHEGVRIIRVRSSAFDRTRLLARAANYLTYLGESMRVALLSRRPDVVLCMTDPPVIANVALVVARRFRRPLVVVSQDVFPEIAVRLGRLTNPVLVRVLDVMTRFYLRRADRVVAIGESMRRRLQEKGVKPNRLRVIPNWTDTTAITPADRNNGWAHEHDLVDRFVVMHSGNIGHAQDLETLIRASTQLRDFDRLTVALVGFGARHAYYEKLVAQLGASAVRFLPYQPRELLSQSLSSADLHFVGLARGLAGYVVPSRLYGILAAGRPVLVSADEESETAQLVRTVGCGVVVPPGEPEQVATAIRSLAGGEHDLAEMGRRGRAYVETEAGRDAAFGRYRSLLAELS